MHDILTDRNDYVHVKKAMTDSNEILNILIRTSLVVIAEFGMMPRSNGTSRANSDYFNKFVAHFKIQL